MRLSHLVTALLGFSAATFSLTDAHPISDDGNPDLSPILTSPRCSTNAECLRLGQPLLRPKHYFGRRAAQVTYGYTGSEQIFTATEASAFEFIVTGAQGGGAGGGRGGFGLSMNCTLVLDTEEQVEIYVGQQGASGGSDFTAFGGGGGGGTFVLVNGQVAIVAAGGGGSASNGGNRGDATVAAIGDGQDGHNKGGGAGGTGGEGGAGGSGTIPGPGGGGGGVLSDGLASSDTDFGGQGGNSLQNGLAGGASFSQGGYGGGGGGGTSAGGGGGGYSGGGGGGTNLPPSDTFTGGAGGSYFNPVYVLGTPVYSLATGGGDGSVTVVTTMD